MVRIGHFSFNECSEIINCLSFNYHTIIGYKDYKHSFFLPIDVDENSKDLQCKYRKLHKSSGLFYNGFHGYYDIFYKNNDFLNAIDVDNLGPCGAKQILKELKEIISLAKEIVKTENNLQTSVNLEFEI